MKLGLGTVQFGLDYGVSNTSGQTSLEEVQKIIDYAAVSGVEVLDTAFLYGSSEEVLGKVLPSNHPFKIVTKTSKISDEIVSENAADALIGDFEQSLNRLQQESVYGLLLHDADVLFKDGAEILVDRLRGIKQGGLVQKIGVSVYTQEQIERGIELNFCELIQLPVNVYDQRLVKSGMLRRLKDNRVEIHARSTFLQGLLLMRPDELPEYFSMIDEHHRRYWKFIEQKSLSPVQSALMFLNSLHEIGTVVCGVNNLGQFEELVGVNLHDFSLTEYVEFAVNDLTVIDPVEWGKIK